MNKKIIVSNVSKTFDANFKGEEGALFRLFSLINRTGEKREIRALRDVSFTVAAGEKVGLIGRNGAGKSTLLRTVAGIYKPDRGTVKTFGNVVYLNGFGHGLKPKLTARENVFLMGAIMGIQKREMGKVFENIAQFSGLGEFLDAKVHQFSSGMITRLNFSVGIHCLSLRKPDVLLVDEIVNSAGDIDFNQRALQKIEELMNSGAAVVMASHNLETIKKNCSVVVFLHNGSVVQYGAPQEVVERYKNFYSGK